MTEITTGTTQPADVLVVFGITGDLAKVMTFRSLYRLEQRKLLDCPIVGVAFEDWDVDQLRTRARESIVATGETLDEEVFARLAARLSYVSGDFGDEATYARVADAIKGRETPVFYLEIPPSLFGRVIQGLHTAGLTANARVVVEKPFGHDAASARALADELHAVHRRGAAVPDRPLPREDGPGRDPPPALRQRHARADLEPQLRGVGADHHGRDGGLRGPRQLLRPRGRPARRGRQPPHADGRRHRHGGSVAGRPQDGQGRHGVGVPRRGGGLARPPTSAGSTRATARSTGSPPTSTTETFAALSPVHRQLALVRRAVLHPHGQADAGAPDRAAARAQAAAAARVRLAAPPARAQPAGRARRPGDRRAHPARRQARRLGGDRADHARHDLRRGGRRGRDAVRGPAARGDDR